MERRKTLAYSTERFNDFALSGQDRRRVRVTTSLLLLRQRFFPIHAILARLLPLPRRLAAMNMREITMVFSTSMLQGLIQMVFTNQIQLILIQ